MSAIYAAIALGALSAFVVGPLGLAIMTTTVMLIAAACALALEVPLTTAALYGIGAWVGSQAGYFTVILSRGLLAGRGAMRSLSGNGPAKKKAAIDRGSVPSTLARKKPFGAE